MPEHRVRCGVCPVPVLEEDDGGCTSSLSRDEGNDRVLQGESQTLIAEAARERTGLVGYREEMQVQGKERVELRIHCTYAGGDAGRELSRCDGLAWHDQRAQDLNERLVG